MTSALYISPLALFVITLCITFDTCRGGLKNQRNFAHVYGKRASSDAYNVGLGGQKVPKFPGYAGEFPVDYEPSDDNYLIRREDAKVNAKANVGHMFGRELYDNYPAYSENEMYNIPELEDENIVEVPNVRADEMIRIPLSPDDELRGRAVQRERLLLRNILKASTAAKMEALAYLDNVINDRRSKA
ncbi:uncharacterized protein LOC123538726 [Mercenaria mercenaria]|uniref:uncharacterized protein LOC123538726 n=1 Tax=Mercenaria mercenaria TaxID=6596 RepID=UPI00234F7F40|nr:uncharacterized protein LOC123538726 [Mercenaria mercenaria]